MLGDRDKRRMVAQIIGQAYMKAHHLMLHNKDKVEHIADVVIQKKEIYGDELVRLLNGANLQIPERRPDGRERHGPFCKRRAALLARVLRAGRAARRRGRNVRRADRASRAEAASAVVGVAADRRRTAPRARRRSPRTSRLQYRLGERQAARRRRRRRPGRDGPDPGRRVSRGRSTRTQQSDIISAVETDKTAMYILCGDGPNCTINEGKPSDARGKVLRREALELALYTFRYVDDTDSVVAFFPPGKGQEADARPALHEERALRPARLAAPANAPAREASPSRRPHRRRAEGDRHLTGPRVFKFRVEQGQSGARVLVLVPETAGPRSGYFSTGGHSEVVPTRRGVRPFLLAVAGSDV